MNLSVKKKTIKVPLMIFSSLKANYITRTNLFFTE